MMAKPNSHPVVYPLLVVMSVLSVWFGLIHLGCAPVPQYQEEISPVRESEPEDTLTTQERDSLVAVYRSFAYERWKNKDYATAIQHFYTVHHYDIHHQHNIYRLWADCFNQANNLDSALWAYQEGVKYFPRDDYLRASLAIALRNKGMLREAIVHQEEAVRIKREAWEKSSEPDKERLKEDLDRYLNDLEGFYEMAEEWDKAIAVLEELSQRNPNNLTLRQRLTHLVRTLRSPEEYLAKLKSQLEQFPDDFNTRYTYAQELYAQGHYRQAVVEWERYLKAKPEDAGAWRNLGQARKANGEIRGAIEAFTKSVSLEETAADMVEIGRLYLELEDWAQSRRWLARAKEKGDEQGEALVALGDLYFRCAEKFASDPPKFVDKLVYAIAYGLYSQAARSPNPTWRAEGEKGKRNLELNELIPTREDRFMNRKVSLPSGKGYEWIDPNWSEVKFLEQFLSGLD